MSSIISGLNIKNIYEYDSTKSYSQYDIIDFQLVPGLSVYPSYTGFGNTGLTTWFNNDYLDSFDTNSTFDVSGWLNLVEKSGNLIQSSEDQYLNPYIDFNEYYINLFNNQKLSGTGFASNSRTFLALVDASNIQDLSQNRKIFQFCTAYGDSSGVFLLSGTNDIGAAKIILDSQQYSAVCPIYDTKNIFTIVQDNTAGTIKVRQNGFQVGVYNSYHSNWEQNFFIIGDNAGSNGIKYYELIHFSGVLNETQIDYYEKYLYEKYFDNTRLFFAKKNVPVGETYSPITFEGKYYWTQDIDQLFKFSYGSSVNFSSNLSTLEMGDGYRSNIAKNINTLQATFNLNYDGLTDEQAKCLIAYFENSPETTNKSIYEGFKGVNINLFDPYKNNAELYFKTINHTTPYNNINNIKITAESLYDSSIDYKGMLVKLDENYIKTYTDSVYSINYNDVFYYPSDVFNIRGYYYYTGANYAVSSSGPSVPLVISPENSPTGNNSYFTNKFYFKGEIDYGFDSSIRLVVNDQKNSTIQYEKDGINYNLMQFNVDFKSRTNSEARAILKFLDDKAGFKIFEYVLPQPYNKIINVYCPEWSHTYNFYNNNDINIKLIEVKSPVKAESVFNTIISWSS